MVAMGTGFMLFIGSFLYLFLIGLIRYIRSREIYFNGMDITILVYYILFGASTSLVTYVIGLFILCVILSVWGAHSKTVGDIFFNDKYYLYRKK
jgi:hypothetical protein